MNEKKFDPQKLEKLNNPQRLKDIPPDYVWDKLNLEKADVLVEIGAGTAFFSIAFVQRTQPSKLFACDVSDVMIDWVTENVIEEYPAIIPLKTEENTVPLDDEIADLVFMIALHHELENPAAILKEAERILKPGGTLFIVDWKKKDMREGPPTHIRCLPEEVAQQMLAAGFVQVHIFKDLPKHFLVIGKKGPHANS